MILFVLQNGQYETSTMMDVLMVYYTFQTFGDCEDHPGSKKKKISFAIQRYSLIITQKQNIQVLAHTFVYYST